MYDKDICDIYYFCRSSEIYISKAYDLVLQKLKKKNSQIRINAFLICKELFKRSALFRELIIKDLELIYKLSAEINSKSILPPPKLSAENLKVLALETLSNWVKEYGDSYKKLKIAYNYFKTCHNVNFDTYEVINSAERQRQEENEIYQRNRNIDKINNLMKNVNGK